MTFTEKFRLILIFFIPVLVYLIYNKYKKYSPYFKFISDLEKVFKRGKLRLFGEIWVIGLILVMFTLILANPQTINSTQTINKKWIDIVFALDISKSMDANDLQPSRIEAAKNILEKFIDKLKNDRIWLVVFAGKPIVSLPLTFDYNIVKQTIKNITTDTINQNINWLDWTNIWDSLLMASNLFKDKKRQKIIILLTDWDTNRGINPQIAAKYLAQKNIKVYTIWIGSPNWGYITYKIWPFIQKQYIPPLNWQALKQIAEITNWKYFRATSNDILNKIFKSLEKLTKTNIKVKKQILYKPIYWPFAWIILFLLTWFLWIRTKHI